MPTLSERLARIEEQNIHIMRDLDRASRSNARLHERFDDIITTVSGLATTMAQVAPQVDRHERAFQRTVGRRELWGKLCGMMTKGRVAAAGVLGAGGLAGYLHWPWWR